MDTIQEWTADIVGLLHFHRISQKRLAEELKVTPEYVSMVLNGKKTPSGAEQRFRSAVQAIVADGEK